jgi:hypothetical protein
MLMWLWNIVVGRKGCEHVWVTEATAEIFDRDGSDKPVNWDKHLCCTKCGDWKRVRL